MKLIRSNSMWSSILPLMVGSLVIGSGAIMPGVGADEPNVLAEQIRRLDSPYYSQRQAAARFLFEHGTHSDDSTSRLTLARVRTALQHPSLEVRLAATELLDKIETHRNEVQLSRLRDPRVPAQQVTLPGWKLFAIRAGDDMVARQCFVRITSRFPGAIDGQRHSRDPVHLRREDTLGWVMALWRELDESQPCGAGSQLDVLLSQASLGPIIDRREDSVVLSRMIGCWLERVPVAIVPIPQKLRIALRYNQVESTHRMIDAVVNNPASWPEARIAALLAAGVLKRDDVVTLASESLKDRRTGCIWHMVATEKRRIRTQVRDVAMVVLLQHRGIDPRSAGFRYLEADAVWIFRDHSLGFPDEHARTHAHQRSTELLERITLAE